ncbi:MAG TPA: ribonuclease J [Candidatus Paceibacterota bacterium]|nr:ribonuclease J [Candidatus Paceibacterota bacterium]
MSKKQKTKKKKKVHPKNKIGKPKAMRVTQMEKANIKPSVKKKPKGEMVRFCALGGLEEIGRNMMFLEYKDEILIIDMGLQFPEDETPGIDFIIPNTKYLEMKKKKIKGVIITHGHYDHIGAIPYLLDSLGNPKIYTTELTKEVIKKRQGDFPNSPKPIFEIVKPGETHQISKNFKTEFFGVEHNIPEGVGLLIHTPIGKVVHPGEFKFDYDKEGNPKHLEIWDKLGEQDIHTLMLDSTGSETPGWSVSERVVEKELEKLFKKAEGRIIVSTFSSLLDRLKEIIKIAEKLNKVVAISGYSMQSNLNIAKRLGFIKTKKDTLIPLKNVNKYPDNKVMILSTGAQGEENASLMRIANGEHKSISIKDDDTVILSSSVVPGNEKSVQDLKDNLTRQGASIYDYKMLDIHSSGHAPQEELKTVMKKVDPKFFLPIHGFYFMRKRNALMAQETIGLEPENTILSDNGLIVELKEDSIEITGEQVPSSYVLVDGLGVGDIGEVVLRDRRTLAEEGMVVLITTISKKNGKILKSPDIISRGFVYLKDNKGLLNKVRRKIRGIIGRIPNRQSLDMDYVKTLIQDQIGKYLYKRTKRRPMILPVMIEV